jgi:hypothetical protein
MTPVIRHDTERQRFIASLEGHSGVLDYRVDGDIVSMDRVVVPDAIAGRGVAAALTRHALDDARTRGWHVRPRCPYVRKWIERHDEYRDLVAE